MYGAQQQQPVNRGGAMPLVRPPAMTAFSAANAYSRGDNECEFTSRNTSLETCSRSPSPNPKPVPGPVYEYYGTANLTDRSRSPGPAAMLPLESAIRKPVARQPPPAAPKKPSALNLSPFYVGGNMPHALPSPWYPSLTRAQEAS